MNLHQDVQQGYARRSRLVRYLAVVYVLLVFYASLYPFEPWRPFATSPFAYLFEPWPRYYSAADVAINIIGYLPLGILLTLSAVAWATPWWAAVFATALGTVVSLSMETLQSYLPQRVPSNLDLLSNGLGALIGAVVAASAGRRLLLSGRLYRLRQRIFLPGALVDAGFVILVLWLFTQLYPAVWLFGNGDLRFWLNAVRNLAYTPESYRWIETGVTALNLAGIGLFVSALARAGRSTAMPLLLLISTAVLLKSVAAAGLFKPGDASLWLTPGAMVGVPLGVVLYVSLMHLPRQRLAPFAALILLAGALLVNAAPENPYITRSVMVWQVGHFLSFNGITRLVSSFWPFVAAAYLSWFASLQLQQQRRAERPGAASGGPERPGTAVSTTDRTEGRDGSR
jgi:VanZ family protein